MKMDLSMIIWFAVGLGIIFFGGMLLVVPLKTILKLMINELNPIEGNIQIEGQDIKSFRQWESIGYVNQKSNSFSSSFPATVTEVVSMNLCSRLGLFKKIKKNIGSHSDKQGLGVADLHTMGKPQGACTIAKQ